MAHRVLLLYGSWELGGFMKHPTLHSIIVVALVAAVSSAGCYKPVARVVVGRDQGIVLSRDGRADGGEPLPRVDEVSDELQKAFLADDYRLELSRHNTPIGETAFVLSCPCELRFDRERGRLTSLDQNGSGPTMEARKRPPTKMPLLSTLGFDPWTSTNESCT